MPSRKPRTGRAAVWTIAAALALAGSALAPVPAQAGTSRDSGVQKVQKTVLPYWQVGDVDRGLSRMCSQGQFNQRIPFRFAGHFYGPFGAALLGAAKGTGLNLFDPYRKRDPKKDYWFYRDRTSACIVMSAPVKDPTAPPTVPQPPGGAPGVQAAAAAAPAR